MRRRTRAGRPLPLPLPPPLSLARGPSRSSLTSPSLSLSHKCVHRPLLRHRLYSRLDASHHGGATTAARRSCGCCASGANKEAKANDGDIIAASRGGYRAASEAGGNTQNLI